jgi:hypothetical protein
VPVRQIIIEYVYDEETGVTVAEQGLVKLERAQDWPWLFDRLSQLSDDEILYRFKKWPGLARPEGVWGTINLGPFWIMCQLDVPEPQERTLGRPVVLKVDLASDADSIRQRIGELGG